MEISVLEGEAKWIKDQYPYGCPDCGEDISDFVEDGDECPNCGHVFYVDNE